MHELVIEAGRGERLYWKDLWRYRELFYLLAWRDILVRYKQTAIGVLWGLIRPMLTLTILCFVFGRLAKLPSGGAPYPVLVLAGLLPWQFFASAFAESGQSLVTNARLISKIYFPRLVVPASSVITSFVDFMISAALLAVLMVYFQYVPSGNIFFLPIFIAAAFAVAFGAGLWVSALMVRYRDFRFIVPFIVQFGLYLSPVGFSSTLIPEKFRLLYFSLNPMAGVIDGFRWSILGGNQEMYWPGFGLSMVGVALLIASGIYYFRKTERSFADII